MKPEEIIYNAVLKLDPNYSTDFSDFSTSIYNNRELLEGLSENLYSIATPEIIEAIDTIRSSYNTGQEGNLEYETNEEVEARKKRQEEIDNFVPVTKNGEIDFEYYDGLGMMEKEKYLFTEWLKQHPEADPSASEVNTYPSVTNQVGVQLNYDPSEYIGVQIKNVLEEEKEFREQKLKEDAEIYEAEEKEVPVVEEVFSEEAFTPYEATETGFFQGADIGAEGFRIAFQDEMPENIKFYTYESLRQQNTPYYSEAPAEAKRMRANGQDNFLFVQVTDKNGNKQVHKVKSFAEDEEDRQDPKKAQQEFINFISPHLSEQSIQKLKQKDKEISQKVSQLFQDSLTEKDFSFAPDPTIVTGKLK